MCHKVVKVTELVEKMLQCEGKWTRMGKGRRLGTNGKEASIPGLWKMAAMLKLCPKEIQDMVELRWDEVGEKYETLKDRVVGWATTRTEKKGGPVPMDVDEVEEEDDEEEDLEKLQAEIARMEAEAARITKETEALEQKNRAGEINQGTASAGSSSAAATGANGEKTLKDGYVYY